MSAPSIILPAPFALVRKVSSDLLGIKFAGSNLVPGVIDLIYATSDFYVAGNYIIFDPSKGSQIVYGSTIYILIDEKYIYGNEGLPVIS